jgi:hypothetical protein
VPAGYASLTRPTLAFRVQVQEARNPGFLRRFEKHVKDDDHQRFWPSPSSVAPSGPTPSCPRRVHPESSSWALRRLWVI